MPSPSSYIDTFPLFLFHPSFAILPIANETDLSVAPKQEFIAPLVLAALNDLQQQQVFSYSNLTLYSDFKANELLGEYAKLAWAK